MKEKQIVKMYRSSLLGFDTPVYAVLSEYEGSDNKYDYWMSYIDDIEDMSFAYDEPTGYCVATWKLEDSTSGAVAMKSDVDKMETVGIYKNDKLIFFHIPN